MFFKPSLIALGALLASTGSAGDEGTPDTYDMEIEGVTVLMSADEVAAEWSHRGYVRTPPRRGNFRPDPDTYVAFHAASPSPETGFISSLAWQFE